MKKIILGLIISLYISGMSFANTGVNKTYNDSNEIVKTVNNPKMKCTQVESTVETTYDGHGNVVIHSTVVIHCVPVE